MAHLGCVGNETARGDANATTFEKKLDELWGRHVLGMACAIASVGAKVVDHGLEELFLGVEVVLHHGEDIVTMNHII